MDYGLNYELDTKTFILTAILSALIFSSNDYQYLIASCPNTVQNVGLPSGEEINNLELESEEKGKWKNKEVL